MRRFALLQDVYKLMGENKEKLFVWAHHWHPRGVPRVDHREHHHYWQCRFLCGPRPGHEDRHWWEV